MVFPIAALRSAHKLKTYIDEVVGGELLSVVVCLECNHVRTYVNLTLQKEHK